MWEGILGRGPSPVQGSEAQVQCVFDQTRERIYGLRWMEEMRLDLILLAPYRVCFPPF